MSCSKRNNVKIFDSGKWSMVLAHGFGRDQNVGRNFEPLCL
ncbi:hypothetical protein [Paraburkholderia haematera]|jgi:hypothetical protein|uniref:Uncharacterized protein n=1 Tax=Paraburkholderia haematera TaxID=2793077 RepID=A0ABM8QXV1_9BURK|nr:hypothetical protein [Paraburkholderia haematera]CAE6721947.1 hypothetical protein R69888_01649 [Paraburkholderia haematera]